MANILRVSGLFSISDLDLTPFAFIPTGALMAWGFFRYRLFDLVPVAHSVVLANMHDGIVVLDGYQRVVEINPAAAHFLSVKADDIVGRPIEKLFPAPSDLIQYLRQTEPISEISLTVQGNKRHFELSRSPLMDATGNKTGKLLVFRDITVYQQTLEALRESEERFRQLTEAAMEGVVISNQGIILATNPQYLQIFGYQDHPDELIGKSLLDISDPGYHSIVKENIFSDYDQNYRIMGIRRDGTTFPLEIRGRNSSSHDHHIRVATVKDITQQLRIEEEIKRREAILQAVSFAAGELLSGSQLETDIPKVLKKLGEATLTSRVYIYQNHADEQGELLTSQVYEWTAPGVPPQINTPRLLELSYEKTGLQRWRTTLDSGSPILGLVRDFPEPEQKILIAQGIISILAVPIQVENAWWGFIGFDDRQNPRAWDNIEIEALETAANSLGAAIARHETEKRLRRRANELNSLYMISLEIIGPHQLSELLQKIVEQARLLLGGSGGGLYLADPPKREVECVVSLGTPKNFNGTSLKYGEGAAGIVAQTQEPLLIKDYRTWSGRASVYEEEQPFKSLISAPLMWKGTLTGVIHVLQSSQVNFFNCSDLELLTLFANQAAIAIQNSHLYAAERRRVEELSALRATLTDISAELDLPRLLQAILERAVALLGGSGGDLCLYKPASQSVEVVVSYNLGKDYTGLEFPLGEGAMGRVIQTGKPVIVPDYQEWEGRMDEYSSQPWHAALAVPLKIGGRVLGSVGVVQADTDREFDENDVSLFESFAQQAAIAIENAHLFDEMESYARRMALLNDITRVAVTAPDLQNMMQRLADRLGELFSANDVFITLWDPHLQIPIPSAAYGQFRDQYPHLHAEPGEDTMTKAVLLTGKVLVAEDVTKSSYVSPRIAAMFSTRAALGIPLTADERNLGAALISYNQPRRFSQDDILLGEQAGAQVALAIVKAQSLEIEKQRTQQLARANSMIMALGRVASRFEVAPDPDSVMQTLGTELIQLGVHCLVALHTPGEPGLIIRYLSLPDRLIRLAERLAGSKIHEYRIDPARFPFYEDVIENRQACISNQKDTIIRAALPGLQSPILQRVAAMYGVTDQTHWFFLPLVADEKVIGTLWMWGDMLEEAALPAATIFASQVAVALENARLYNEIQQLAITDELTALYNRRGILELGQREVDRALRYNRPLTAVMLDIDHFKLVNDRYGHPLGDEVLRWLAEICRNNVREIDIVGRYGGEEYLILLPESEMRNSTQLAERLRQRVADAKIPTRVGELSITISLGLSELNESTRDLKTLIARSDQALYAAKHAGRNRVITR